MSWRTVVGLGLLACTWGCSRTPSRATASADTSSLAPLADSGVSTELGGSDRQMRTGSQSGQVATRDRPRPSTRSGSPEPTRREAKPRAGEPVTQGYSPAAESTVPATADTASKAPTVPRAADSAARVPRAVDSAAQVPNAGDSAAQGPSSASRDTAIDARAAVGDSVIPSATAPSPPAPSTSSPSATASPTPAARAPANALPAGSQIRAILQDSITSLRNSAGQTVTAVVSGDLRAPDGLAVLPSGSVVRLTIQRLSPARTRSAKDGELVLRADSVTAHGHTYRVDAAVQPIPHELRGRGVTAGEVEKVGAGAAAGAVVGAVATGKTKGAVVGGAVGAVGGAVVAAQTASRDVVVAPRTLIILILRSPVVRAE